jgi:hypothetical protein
MENGYIESYNGKFRDGIRLMRAARSAIRKWDYDESRPHRLTKRPCKPPTAFARIGHK